jgi:hypothetical protein
LSFEGRIIIETRIKPGVIFEERERKGEKSGEEKG